MYKTKKLAAVLFVALVLSLLVGCQTSRDPNVLYEDTLSDELKTTIAHKLLLQYDVVIDWGGAQSAYLEPYYGTINDCVVLMVEGAPGWIYALGLWEQEIAGYAFKWYEAANLYVYCNAEVCTLKEAYERGLLTAKQIGVIYEKHSNNLNV